MICQLCKKKTIINISICKSCYKVIKVKSWNDWVRNTPKNKIVKKVKFNNTIIEEINLMIKK